MVYFWLRSFARQRCREISVGACYASRLSENLARAAVAATALAIDSVTLATASLHSAKPRHSAWQKLILLAECKVLENWRYGLLLCRAHLSTATHLRREKGSPNLYTAPLLRPLLSTTRHAIAACIDHVRPGAKNEGTKTNAGEDLARAPTGPT